MYAEWRCQKRFLERHAAYVNGAPPSHVTTRLQQKRKVYDQGRVFKVTHRTGWVEHLCYSRSNKGRIERGATYLKLQKLAQSLWNHLKIFLFGGLGRYFSHRHTVPNRCKHPEIRGPWVSNEKSCLKGHSSGLCHSCIIARHGNELVYLLPYMVRLFLDVLFVVVLVLSAGSSHRVLGIKGGGHVCV